MSRESFNRAIDHPMMIIKQPAWGISRAGGSVTKNEKRKKRETKKVKVTDLHTGQEVVYDSCVEFDNINGWNPGRTSQAGKRKILISKRYKIEHLEEK